MRIAFSRSQRTQPCTSAGHVLRTCIRPRHPCRIGPTYEHASNPHRQYTNGQVFARNQDRGTSRLQTPQPQVGDTNRDQTHNATTPESMTEGEMISPHAHLPPHVLHQKRRSINTWIRLLEKYLPPALRQRAARGDKHESRNPSADCRNILAILQAARKKSNAETDILAHLITSSRRKAGLWLCDYLLKHLHAGSSSRPSDLLPSNILWPERSLNAMTKKAIHVETVSYTSFEESDNWNATTVDPRYSSDMSDIKDRTMDQIWSTLGTVVVQSTSMDDESAQKAMNAVQLVLGQLHNLDLVPDNVYAYQASPLSATVQRPPIVHLVSSRILTALSDAAWREQQEENIEKAASHGLSYQEIGRDPPGGRFRLKVSPMGPEVWLEFILWCCVEGGFASAGARIINLLQRDAQDPWFAIAWSNNGSLGHIAPHIDWERVRSRTGGTVGRIEGYSKVKPLADVPSRTISTEVVLALVEANVDTIRRVPNGNGLNLEAAQFSIVNLISFLEPHNLPIFYFDYLSARLMQTEAFDTGGRWKALSKWYSRLTLLKSLKPVQKSPPPQVSFSWDAVLMHSECTAGLLHQVLDSHVQEGNVHDALKAFNELQKLVDNSKLHSIGAFLQQAYAPDENFFSSRFFTGNPDFVNSHGQLPTYRLAGVLNLATDTNLVGLGQWLLYNDDPDGPLISRSAYGNAGIARAIIRFAAMSNDVQLLKAVLAAASPKRRPTVNFLRASFNAQLALLDFTGVKNVLDQLGRAQGGGYGLHNLAYLAATILRIERDVLTTSVNSKENVLYRATYLLSSMLSGHMEGPSGIFQQAVRTKFKQQVAHLLTVFGALTGSAAASIAGANQDRFRATNIPNLPPSIFNTVLEGVLDSKGASDGAILVDALCTSTLPQSMRQSAQEEEDESDVDVDMDVDDELTMDEESDPILDGSRSQASSQLVPKTQTPASGSGNTEPHGVDSSGSHHAATPDFIPFASSSTGELADYLDSEAPLDVPVNEQVREGDVDSRYGTNQTPQASQGEILFASPFFPQDAQFQPPANKVSDLNDSSTVDIDNPVCVYNTRTIRLVVQKAIREMRERNQRGSPIFQQQGILKWARKKLQQIGCSPEMIQNEVREPARVEMERPMFGEIEDEGQKMAKRKPLHKKSSSRSKSKRATRVGRTFSGTHVLKFPLGEGD